MQELAAELRLSSAYPFRVEHVDLIETHISWVFLAGPFAYKVKKPVDFGFVDYSTLDRRRQFCEAEVRLNSRLAPDVYLGVMPITRWGDSVRFEGVGDAVEYAVKMRRLPDERMLDRLLASGKVTILDVERLAQRIASFHASTQAGPDIDHYGSLGVIEQNWRENFEQVQPFVGHRLTHSQYAQTYGFVRREIERLAAVFEQRVREGRIRDCHGDLRSESVWMDEAGDFRVFDCIEFNERLRYGDVASEVAFLASDLDWRGRPDLAWSWVEAYVAASGDRGLFDVLPFYKCYRAFVRGKVEALEQHGVAAIEERCRHGRAAREHFQLAEWYTFRFSPTLFLTCGQVGSGKTTLARGLGSILGLPVLSSDRVRKRLANLDPRQHVASELDQGLYGADFNRRTYDELYRQARELLREGGSVIVDATFNQAAERQRAMQAAHAAGAGYLILNIEAPDSVIYQRLAARALDQVTESDAGSEVFERVRTRFEAPEGVPARCLLQVPVSDSIQTSVQSAITSIRHQLSPDHDIGRTA